MAASLVSLFYQINLTCTNNAVIYFLILINLPLFAQFNYPDFSSVEGLNLIEDAAQIGDTLRISPSDLWQKGAVWNTNKQKIQNGFSTTFQFQINDLVLDGADGFAFVIQNYSDSTIGGLGRHIGYDSIPNSIAVEFDTYHNSNLSDPNSNHISVQTSGINPNSSHHSHSIGYSTNIPDLSDGNIHTIKIEYTPDTLRIFIDDLMNFVLEVNLDIENTLNLDNGSAWVGFTAGSGDLSENHDLINWSLYCSTITSITLNENKNVTQNYQLYQNYPNPFNPTTQITYDLPRSSYVTLTIYDLLGRAIQTLVSEFQTAGNHSVNFDGGYFSSGVYFYKLKVGNEFLETKKMILMR